MKSFEEYWNEHGDVYGMEIAEDAWDYQQSKIDALTLQVAEMKSRLNDAYTDGQSAMYAARQTKVDELQKRVDAAIRLLVEAELYQSEPNIDLAVQALKGGSDANQ